MLIDYVIINSMCINETNADIIMSFSKINNFFLKFIHFIKQEIYLILHGHFTKVLLA